MVLSCYLMESEEEAIRLDLKTSGDMVERQATRVGIKPGMRVLDLGCGSGKTTFHLHRLVQPGGTALGLDISQQRIQFAKDHYGGIEGIEFALHDVRNSLNNFGQFDFVWIRFLLEYFRSTALAIVRSVVNNLKPGGILCLIDLDYNCLTHYGLPNRLEMVLNEVMKKLQGDADFDPFVGRKLYSFLYDLKFKEINVFIDAHHLIYGHLAEEDRFNWQKKVEVAARHSGYRFEASYPDGFSGFMREFTQAFGDPRRFTYTPMIACWGRKP